MSVEANRVQFLINSHGSTSPYNYNLSVFVTGQN